jgi:C1A family cysteine protease
MSRFYGWSGPSRPDRRDFQAAIPPAGDDAAFPPARSLAAEMPPIWNQLELGSCVANATARIVLHRLVKQGKATLADTPSRLFIYYGGRAIEHTVMSDSGLQVRDGLKVAATLGCPPETDWPYNIAEFTVLPSQEAYRKALNQRAIRYYTMPKTRWNIKWCINNDYPVAFGIPVYESFESEATAMSGLVPVPSSEESPVGGHSMVIIGYDDTRQLYLIDNSWGEEWGDKGRCWIPYGYFESEASDLWTVRLES